MAPLRCVTFELTGTLISMSVPLGKVYADAVRYFKLPCPGDNAMKAAFKAAYGSVSKELPNFGADAGIPERKWWDRMIKATLAEAGCNEALDREVFPLVFQRVYSAFGARSGVWAECPDGIDAMRHAKEAGLVVGAVCNCYHRYVDNNMPLLGLHEHLDFATISYEEGVSKPSPALYEAAMRRATTARRLLHGSGEAPVKPWEVLHVGDDLTNDFLAAKRLGQRALLFDPKGTAPAHEELSPGEVVRSLAEVPAKIDELLSE